MSTVPPHRSSGVLTSVARGGAAGGVGAVLSSAAGFGLVVLVTRAFPPDVAGQFFSATAAFLLVAAVVSLGTDAGLGRFLPRLQQAGQHSAVPQVLRAALVPVLILSGVVAVAGLFAAPTLAAALGLPGPQAAAALMVLALGVPAYCLAETSLSATRAFGSMRPTVVVDRLGRSVGQFALVAGAAWFGAGLGGLALAWVLPFVAAAVAAALVLRRTLSARGALPAARSQAADRALARQFWSFTWPRSIAKVAQMLLQRADIVLIGILLGPVDAALYTAATRFVPLGQMAAQAIQQSVQPRFSTLLARGELGPLQEVFATATAWTMAVAWPIYALVGAAPAAYLSLFGPDYVREGSGVVVLMAGALAVACATGPVDTLLLMAGRSTLSLVNSLVALAVDLGLCLLLIPRLGIAGAAIGWALASVTRALLATWQVRRELGFGAWGRGAGIVATLVGLCLLLPVATTYALGLRELPVLVLVVGVGAMGYAAGLWRFRATLRLDAFGGLLAARRRASSRRELV